MPEIYSPLVAKAQYFERFQKEIHKKASTLQSVLGIVSHLQGLLLARGQTEISDCLLEQFTDYFILDPIYINSLIKSLDKEKDYQNLAWLLAGLWEKYQKSRARGPDSIYTLALGCMLVITLYLDIVYNYAREHGHRHSSTVEMTVLLSQMYTSVVQGYQGTADHQGLATQYYRKAAALHENALRIFMDPSSVATAHRRR
ncbi:hypothetical protein BDV09DRAFT_201392 [Aspergillus tetrazonus]